LFLFDTAVTLLMFASFAAWAVDGERVTSVEESRDFGKSWLPERGRSSLRLAAPVVLGLIVVIDVSGINIRTYRGAQLVTETGATVQDVTDNQNHFSPLETFSRERLLNAMSSRWENMFPFEWKEMIDELEHEVKLALDAEPDNMELHFAVARFYRAAATDVPEMLSLARDYTERGIELGPNTASAELALEQQIEAETNLSPIR
jgi:hypothetical protein